MKIHVIIAYLNGQRMGEPVAAFHDRDMAMRLVFDCQNYRKSMPLFSTHDFHKTGISFYETIEKWNNSHPGGRHNADADEFMLFEVNLV